MMSFWSPRMLSTTSMCFSIVSCPWNNRLTESRVPASIISAIWGKSNTSSPKMQWSIWLLVMAVFLGRPATLCLPFCHGQQLLHCNGFRTLQHDLSSACHLATMSFWHSLSCIGCRYTTTSSSNSPFWCTCTYWPVTSIHHRRRHTSKSRAVMQSSMLRWHYWFYHTTNKNKDRQESVQCLRTYYVELSPWVSEAVDCSATFKRQLKTHYLNIYLCRHF